MTFPIFLSVLSPKSHSFALPPVYSSHNSSPGFYFIGTIGHSSTLICPSSEAFSLRIVQAHFYLIKQKMMNRLLTIIMVLLTTTSLFAQTTVSGNIRSQKGDTITGANVFIKDAFDGGSSDANGNFSFTTGETGNKFLMVSMIGYEAFQTAILLNGEGVNLKIVLQEKMNELNTVVISAGSFETGDVKKMAVLNSIDVATTAGATADIFGALKTLPGTQPAGDADGLFVRGGDAHEAKTFFDGILVNNVFTSELPDIAQRGRFSPFMFKGTSFSTGAYSAQYGEAMSSTMSLESKDVAPKTKSDIGIMSVGFDATHTQRFSNSSLELNTSYYNLKPVFAVLPQNTEWTKAPESFNANLFYKMKTGKTGLLKFYTNYEHSHTGILSADFNDITKNVSYDIRSDNLYLNTTWQQFISDTWKVNAGAGYGNDEDKIDIDTNFVHQNEKSFHARATVTHFFGKLSDIKAGVEFFDFKNDESYNELSHQFINPLAAAFLETNYFITRKFALRIGARYEYDGLLNKSNLAPRVSLAYKWNDASQVALGYGKFFEMPEDDFLFEPKSLDFENATHYVLNYQYQKDKRIFRVEAYYKKYDKLVKENNESEAASDNSGYGYSRGIDVFWRDTKTIRHADYWITYSYLDTRRNYLDYPVAATPTFAAKHVANFVCKYFITKVNTSVGATYTYASGRTYFNPNNTSFLSDKTKDYHNFSMNVSYLTSIAQHFTILYVSVENVFGISNVYGYHYSPDGSVRKPIVPSAPRSIFVGLFITFGDDSYK